MKYLITLSLLHTITVKGKVSSVCSANVNMASTNKQITRPLTADSISAKRRPIAQKIRSSRDEALRNCTPDEDIETTIISPKDGPLSSKFDFSINKYVVALEKKCF